MEQFNSVDLNFIFEIIPHKCSIGRMSVGKHVWQQEEEQKRRYQYCTDVSTGHCNNSERILPTYLLYWMCVQCSLYHPQWIDTWRSEFKQETNSIFLLDPRDKEDQYLKKIDLNVPRRAQYLHNAWKRHQDTVFWVNINLAIRKGLTFYQTR